MGYWHHGILSQIDGENNRIAVIQWTDNEDGQEGIFEKWQSVEDTNSVFNQMYRIEYPEEIKQASPPQLVLARARSRKDDTGYGLILDNCETFATYCKSGSAQSHQVSWLKNKMKEILCITCTRSATKIIFILAGLLSASLWKR